MGELKIKDHLNLMKRWFVRERFPSKSTLEVRQRMDKSYNIRIKGIPDKEQVGRRPINSGKDLGKKQSS